MSCETFREEGVLQIMEKIVGRRVQEKKAGYSNDHARGTWEETEPKAKRNPLDRA